MSERNLRSLTDDELLARLSTVVARSRRVESELVAHIAEVDARRLYAREASPSMHKYCTEVLHLSDAEAYFRITAARASRRFPALLTMLEDGRLHLSGICLLASHLTEENSDALLARAAHKTKREIEELVAAIAPRPDVPPRVRKLPEPRSKVAEIHAPAGANPTAAPSGRSSDGTREPDERERVEPLAPARYKVQFTASAELREKLERLSELMPEADLASVIEAAVTEKLERVEAKRYGKVKKTRKRLEDADTSAGSRGISAAVRRFVLERDGRRCTFVGTDGRRCPERHRLEFHHDEPFGRGGDGSVANIRLLCRTHNLYMAEMDYGKATMDRYRFSADRVREPLTALELGPDGVVVWTASSVAL